MAFKPKPQKTYTVAQAQQLLEQYCAYQDRCHKEVEAKLNSLNLIPEAKEQIIIHLIQQGFLNEERFARSFARGKFRIKKWGKLKITNALKQRGINSYLINKALTEIDESEYIDTLDTLVTKKLESLNETSVPKKKKKLIDFLKYRGWESHLIYDKINEVF
jgi:regulatory protein